MERLLSPTMHRRVLLLNVLNESKDWITTEKLAKHVDCSKKTIMQDCQYIEDRWPKYFTIETSRKYGLRLILSPYYSIHDIYVEVIKESNAFSLLESIFFNPQQSAEYWEQELFLSSSSLYRLSNFILCALQDRNIQLKRSPYLVYGDDERQVRYFFTSYFMEIYGVREWPFPLEKQNIFDLANKINREFHLSLSDSQIVNLAYLISVTLLREKQGFFIQKRKDCSIDFFETSVKKDLSNYQSNIDTIVHSLRITLTDDWYLDFCYSVLWWKFGWDNNQEKKNIFRQSNELINRIKKALNIEISKESRLSIIRLFERIYAQHKLFPYKKYMVYDRHFYTSKIIRQTFLIFSAVVEKALTELEIATNFPWSSIYFSEIIYEMVVRWNNLEGQSECLRSPVNILVVSDLGKEHADFIASMLKNYFRQKVIVGIYEQWYCQKEIEKYPKYFDLYISNYRLNCFEEEKNIIVEDVLSFKNITDIGRFIDKKRLVLPKDIPYLN